MTELIGVLLGCFITYFLTVRLAKKEQKKKQQALAQLLNDLLKQIKVILVGTFEGKDRSPYGYFKSGHEETETIMPLLDNIITDIGILPEGKNKIITIQLYTELKNFLTLNKKYQIKLENLKKFRKEMIPEKFVKLNCKNYMDYFDIDPYIFQAEYNPNSIISKDFFKAQKDLIDDLNKLTDLTLTIQKKLLNKIDSIISGSWEDKNNG